MLPRIVLMLFFLLPGPAWAADVPEALTYDGAPIAPHCLAAWSEDPVISLADCAASDEVIPDAKADTLRPNAMGWIEQGFSFAGLEEGGSGWAAWRVVGTTADGIVIETRYNGGGSGTFSAVQTLRREAGDRMRIVATHAGGDRCNGGIAGAAVAGGTVATASWLTPGDVAGLALDAAGLPPLGDSEWLSWCAICCVGTLTEVAGEMAFVSIMAPAEGFASATDTLQSCLDEMMFEGGLQTLEKPALAAFGADFQKRCRR